MSRDAGRLSFETGMLSFARSLQPSEGLFWGTRSGMPDWREPVEVLERGVRGQSSEYKTDNPGKSNPQVVEAAAVPLGCDGVELTFSLWAAPHAMKPWACGDAEVASAYTKLVELYAVKGGFETLARSFLWNVANARFAWRNRYLTDEMRVVVTFEGRETTFDPSRLRLEVPASAEELRGSVVSNDPSARIDELITALTEGLTRMPRFFKIVWWARMEEGAEIFPSQEYLREAERAAAASRVYAKLPRHHHDGRRVLQASMHSQKIGAALRHVDVWHGNAEYDAIAVNPYGGIQETGAVLREPKSGQSFYDLRAKAAALMKGLEDASTPDTIPAAAHFVVANLVRGGVFGQKAEA